MSTWLAEVFEVVVRCTVAKSTKVCVPEVSQVGPSALYEAREMSTPPVHCCWSALCVSSTRKPYCGSVLTWVKWAAGAGLATSLPSLPTWAHVTSWVSRVQGFGGGGFCSHAFAAPAAPASEAAAPASVTSAPRPIRLAVMVALLRAGRGGVRPEHCSVTRMSVA